MKHKHLHDIAKFAAGLVVGDFLCGWWVLTAPSLLPASLFGVSITPEMVGPWMAFDFFLFLTLVHYGWNIGKMPRMKERTYLLVAGVIFAVVAAAHFVRIFTGTDVVILGWYVPLFLSWIAVAVTTYLAYASFTIALRLR